MNIATEIVGAGILLPAAISVAVFSLIRRLFPAETGERYAAACALAAAYTVGYVLLPDWAELLPRRHWHWTLYLTPVAAVFGPIAATRSLLWPERWLVYLGVLTVAAWALVPTWSTLQPPRATWIPLMGGYLFILAAVLEPLAVRLPASRWLFFLALTAVCVALLTAAMVSLTYARVAGVAAAALGGCWVAACCAPTALVVRGCSLAYAVTIGGWAFLACIEPRQPLYAMLLAPLAPAGLWCCAGGYLARWRGRWAFVLPAAIVLGWLLLSIGLVVAFA